MTRLDGKVAIVTGGVGGIGSETVRRFMAEGATVVVADIAEDMTGTVARIFGAGAIPLNMDIGDPASVEAGIAEVARRLGRIDVLFNNAAATGHDIIMADRTLLDTPDHVWRTTMRVNVDGTMLCCKHVLPHMIRQVRGSIINVASCSALAGDNLRIAYGTSKAAIVAMTQYIATQHGGQGVRCNAILPGPILNDALARYPALVATNQRHSLTGRIGKPEDIAAMAAFLAADESEYVTGQAYCVDGGHLAHQPQMADMRPLELPDRP